MNRMDFDCQMNKLLSEAEQLIPNENLPELPFLSEIPDVHGWHAFELALWDKGEEIRQLILGSRKKPDKEQIERIVAICTNSFAKRGRQSFVMLLGKKCYVQYAPMVAGLVADADVDGHAIDTLYKMGSPDYLSQIKPFTHHSRTWIRNTARKYIQKYSPKTQ